MPSRSRTKIVYKKETEQGIELSVAGPEFVCPLEELEGKVVRLELEASREAGHGEVQDGVVGGRDELEDNHEPNQDRLLLRETEGGVQNLLFVQVTWKSIGTITVHN